MNYYNDICKSLKVQLTKRIGYNYNFTYQLDHDWRLESWWKLENFIEVITSRGGYGKINKNKGNLFFFFFGFVPDYAATLMRSKLFLPVVQIDSCSKASASAGYN